MYWLKKVIVPSFCSSSFRPCASLPSFNLHCRSMRELTPEPVAAARPAIRSRNARYSDGWKTMLTRVPLDEQAEASPSASRQAMCARSSSSRSSRQPSPHRSRNLRRPKTPGFQDLPQFLRFIPLPCWMEREFGQTKDCAVSRRKALHVPRPCTARVREFPTSIVYMTVFDLSRIKARFS